MDPLKDQLQPLSHIIPQKWENKSFNKYLIPQSLKCDPGSDRCSGFRENVQVTLTTSGSSKNYTEHLLTTNLSYLEIYFYYPLMGLYNFSSKHLMLRVFCWIQHHKRFF